MLTNRVPMTQRGMTLVELMVGLAIGLFIVATALGLAMAQLHDNRSVLQGSMLSIALESAADTITLDLRRAGYRGDAGAGIARSGSAPVANPNAGVSWAAANHTLLMTYQGLEGNEQFGFRLNGGAIDMKMGNSTWQAITDAGTLTVTAFSIASSVRDMALGSFCERPCPSTTAGCPRQQVQHFDLVLAGRSTTDASVTREFTTSVRVRNDTVTGACPS